MNLILIPAAVETKRCLLVNMGFIIDKISGNILGLTQQKIIFEDSKSCSMLELFFYV